jgi:hypothetical protein
VIALNARDKIFFFEPETTPLFEKVDSEGWVVGVNSYRLKCLDKPRHLVKVSNLIELVHSRFRNDIPSLGH